jgi:hypothetical protein
MSAVNDFGTNYMCQSLPFGGVKHSGFDRFAGAARAQLQAHPSRATRVQRGSGALRLRLSWVESRRTRAIFLSVHLPPKPQLTP